MVTADSVRDAGIAAHLAVDPAVLPEPSIYFQDFNFGGTMWDAAYGNVDGGSVSGIGAAVSDIAIEERMALEAEERKKDDPASDASMIAELAARQREATARFSDGHFYFRGMKLTTDEMNEALQMTRDNLPEIARREGWSDEQLAREESRIDAAIAETDPQRKAILIGEIERDNPVLAEELENSAEMIVESRTENELTSDETAQGRINSIDDINEYQEAALQVLDSADTAGMAIEAINGTVSVASSTDLANSFEAAFSATPAFNTQASGDTQLAQAEPVQTSPTLSGPTLA